MLRGKGRPNRSFGVNRMELLATEVVKEFLKAQGLSRTLKAFEASLLAAHPAGVAAAPGKKAPKFDAPSLDGTDASISRLERMVHQLRELFRMERVNCNVFACSLQS